MGFEPMNVALRGQCVDRFTNRPNTFAFLKDNNILSYFQGIYNLFIVFIYF